MLQTITSSSTDEKSHRVPSVGYSDAALSHDLKRVEGIWNEYRSRRDRDAVYLYLTAVFELVEWWAADKRAITRAGRALNSRDIEGPAEIEPFAAVVIATTHPTKLDKRAVSKWSRVLRYAAKYKSKVEPLQDFIQRKGGINECASRYARRLGRGGPI